MGKEGHGHDGHGGHGHGDHGHGGHGHHEPYEIPDPCKYKVEDVPQLLEVQEALARQGLKDPWLRNEVWRYDVSQFGTHATRARTFFLRGLAAGVAAVVVTIGLEHVIARISPDDHHGHGHGHGHGDGHGHEDGH